MKVLVDENLPHQLRHEIVGHDVFTVAYMGWSGIDNGELLQRAAANDFDVLITNDRGLEYEQNLDSLPIAVIVLLATSNTIEGIRPLYRQLHESLDVLPPRTIVKITA
jgi:hypothetical protein